jgi:hypothetical protein
MALDAVAVRDQHNSAAVAADEAKTAFRKYLIQQ